MEIIRFSLQLIEDERVSGIGSGQSPWEIWNICRELKLNTKPEEHMYVFLLDTKLETIGVSEISHGGIDRSFVNIAGIFKRALLCNSNSIILVHNHPSGKTEISKEDISLTAKVKEVGEALGVSLQDHIVITRDDYYSMRADEESICKIW